MTTSPHIRSTKTAKPRKPARTSSADLRRQLIERESSLVAVIAQNLELREELKNIAKLAYKLANVKEAEI